MQLSFEVEGDEPTQSGPALPASGSISNTPTFLPLNSIIHISHTITTQPLPIIHPSFPCHVLISPLDPSTPPSSTVSPRFLVQSGPRDQSRELAKSSGPGPERQSWAALAQISPSSERR
ncbi:unnamed protein product [Pleuronectes platessa]|uniref:Uncharacterized protein n=1 Tax=Pleuronectes platessa TaxID=8262 RepID=A0A9N7YZ50_PLEPL|nr:unnamed protein product [Pleuronectes platessa]